ncbi:hypothetical protein ABEB36_007356 [Hypothenemus hampei]
MLSPDICNCCDYCLYNLVEGEDCTIGDPSNPKHYSICGPSLTCVAEENQIDGTCQKMSTECALKQQNYDKRREDGYLGTMEIRANCDEDGFYDTYKCTPGQTCHCLHLNGSRIFGEANFNTIPSYMPCACSRAYYDAVEVIGRELYPTEHFRCTENGNYDHVQCINEKCLCVDTEDGAPTFPDDKLVPLNKVTNETLTCYKGDKAGNYYKECEVAYLEIRKEVLAKKNETGANLVIGYSYPSCDLDGTYKPVQENKTHKYCVNKQGSLLTTPLEKNSQLAQTMDCKCARATVIMTSAEKPNCLENGNYNSIQRRRGLCRCVDQDGHQKCSSDEKECEEVEESEAANLNCSF